MNIIKLFLVKNVSQRFSIVVIVNCYMGALIGTCLFCLYVRTTESINLFKEHFLLRTIGMGTLVVSLLFALLIRSIFNQREKEFKELLVYAYVGVAFAIISIFLGF
ncbi:MAG: hypothetical protein ABIO57_00265 [Candidatus Paceibacterota bacterium]